MTRYDPTERIGVNAVERIVIDELGWIFREQPIVDMGIDAHIERVDEGSPTGKLAAVQIKSGLGNFREQESCLVYYGALRHLEYWSGHSLPVVLIAHIPERDETFWTVVDEESAARTRTGWKIEIPKTNHFGSQAKSELHVIFEGSPAQQRLRKLVMDEPLMRHVQEGGKVSLELEDWVNKSLGRTPVRVYVHDDDGNEMLSREWFQYYVGYGPKELAETLFPWSRATVDFEFYGENSIYEEGWESELARAIDEDNGISRNEIGTEIVYPYSDSAGEVEAYRLELHVNELGKAFLTVSEYLSGRKDE